MNDLQQEIVELENQLKKLKGELSRLYMEQELDELRQENIADGLPEELGFDAVIEKYANFNLKNLV